MNENYNMENLNKTPEQKKENKSILFENHKIELLSEEGAVEFGEEHIKKIEKVLNLFSENGLSPAKKFSEFESINNPDAKHRGGFLGSAHIGYGKSKELSAIIFYNYGMNTNKPHRISSSENFKGKGFVDNFSGTLAHELTHGGTTGEKFFDDYKFNREFIQEWREKFGWKYVRKNVKNEKTGRWEKAAPVEGWEKDKDGFWRNNDYIITREEYTTMPEKCIGGKRGYAASVSQQEDICDSVAAYLLNPSILDKEKREFLENKIKEYKQNYKSDNNS